MTREHQLIIQLSQGSYEAFDLLYTMHSQALYGYALSLTQSRSTSADIVQEAFLKVWVNRLKISPELSFKSWLFSIAKNQIYDEFRKQVYSKNFENYLSYFQDENTVENEVEQKLDYDDFHLSLEAAKQKLSPRQREVFVLLEEQGLSNAEVSERLSISEQSVYNYLSQALKILRAELVSNYPYCLALLLPHML